MAQQTQCPNGHRNYQSLHDGEPGSRDYIGVCEIPDCPTPYYRVSKRDKKATTWVQKVLQICEPCQYGQHTCLGFRWDNCNCPCRDPHMRHGEVSIERAARGIIRRKYGIELPDQLPKPITGIDLLRSHHLCLYYIEADQMRLRSLRLQYDNMPRIGMD